MNNLLLFISQSELEFTNECDKLTISISNPYDFGIYFSFKSTRPDAFTLSAYHGEIASRHSLDIVMTLLDKTIVEEKFKIIASSIHNKEKILGEKIIRVTYRASCLIDNSTSAAKRNVSSQHSKDICFHDLEGPNFADGQNPLINKKLASTIINNQVPNQYLIYAALTICLIILMLPHEENSDTWYPSYFQVSVNIKLVAAYILGIVTVFLIRN